MSVNVYLSGNPVHDRVLKAFYDGCPEEKKLVEKFVYQPSDVAVIFGVHKSKVRVSWPRGKVFRQQREEKRDVVVLETGYVNRGDGETHHYAAGFNGLNGRADFRNKNMGPDRWEALGVQLVPYSRGETVILCSQVPQDASVDFEGYDHYKWIDEIAAKIQRQTRRPIIFRPHPLAKRPAPKGCHFSSGPLAEDLKNAHCVVTFNSNSAVEAAILGKPVFAFDPGSMAWEIATKTLTQIEEPVYANRTQWARNLAYTQWTPQEMAEGVTWKHLFR